MKGRFGHKLAVVPRNKLEKCLNIKECDKSSVTTYQVLSNRFRK